MWLRNVWLGKRMKLVVDYSELLEIVTNKIGHIDDLIEYKILSSDSVYIKIPRVKIVKDKQ